MILIVHDVTWPQANHVIKDNKNFRNRVHGLWIYKPRVPVIKTTLFTDLLLDQAPWVGGSDPGGWACSPHQHGIGDVLRHPAPGVGVALPHPGARGGVSSKTLPHLCL